MFRPLCLILSLWCVPSLAVAQDVPSRIEVYPAKVQLMSQRARCQLIVTGHFANGEMRDLTRTATFSVVSPEFADVQNGVAIPKKDGKSEILVTVAGQKMSVPIEVTKFGELDPIRFRTETQAALTKQGCNSGSCHGSPQGKGGFSLSLFGYDPQIDEESLVRGGLNRRVDRLLPDESLLLKKPMMRIAHIGGKKLAKTDAAYRILRDWIAQGAISDDRGPECVKIIVHPGPSRILKSPNVAQQLSVIAQFSDGSVRDVTPIATYETSHKDIIGIDTNGLVTGYQRGQGAISVRYLNHLESVHFTVIQERPNFKWTNPTQLNFVDAKVDAKLQQLQVLPSGLCDDSTFIRRVYLDLTGLLPTPDDVRVYLSDTSVDKRHKLIDRLLSSSEFGYFWAQRTGDLMRVQPKTMPDGRAEKFANWLVDAYRTNMPFDEFTTAILTASGDPRERPAANFFLGLPTKEELTESTSQLFMGSRIGCAKCHNHPFENWTQEDYYRIQAVFARVNTTKEKMIAIMPKGEVSHPTNGRVMQPFGMKKEDKIEPDIDRRTLFAKWLTTSDNPFFARVEVNRIWSYLHGRGIVESVDDFRSSNPPTNVELLDALAAEFVKSKFDRKHMIRLICNSAAYQRSSGTNEFNADDAELFSHMKIRRLNAEQLQDAIGYLCGTLKPLTAETKNRSEFATQRLFPEQSQFLKAFGQPERTSACTCDRVSDPTVDQGLELMNGASVRNRIAKSVDRYLPINENQRIDELYLVAFARFPNEKERIAIQKFMATRTDPKQGIEDLVWVLINTREFLFQH